MSNATNGEGTPATEHHTETGLSHDEIFDVLSNHRRRYALHCLRQNGNRATLGEIAETVAAWETAQSVEAVDATERKRVYTSLQQFHLPKLDEKGIVDFDDRSGDVTLDAAAEDLTIYMEVTEGYDIPWSVYYLGLSGISAVLVGLSWGGITPLAGVPDAGWVLFTLVTLTLFALAHTWFTRHMRLGTEGKPPELKR